MTVAEILTIGDELCRGEVTDTNSSWMASRLWEMGIPVAWMTSCRDDHDDMVRALKDAAGRAAIVLVSGGLGPTEDDLTVDVIAEVAGVDITIDEASLSRMEARFTAARFAMTPNNLRQVRAPRGAEVFQNPAGLAPGFALDLGSARLYVMPGPPREMKAIFDQSVAPRVVELAQVSEKIAKRTYRVFGKGESHIGHVLGGLLDGEIGTSLHYQVLFPETLVKIVVRDADRAVAEARLETLDRGLRERLGVQVYGTGEDTLPIVLGRALLARKETLAVAESCTGGMLGSLLTDVPGSSAYFRGGWIVYANDLKEQLGVARKTLEGPGAVSRECVEEMAAAARDRAGSTWGIAISGVAGPGGGTAEKPVGTVWIAVAGPAGKEMRTKMLSYPGARDQVRRLSSYWGMALLLAELS